MDTQSALGETLIDDALMRVTRWTLAPNTRIDRHRHELPYVVVPIVSGAIAISDERGQTSSQLEAGQPYSRAAGAEHLVSSLSTSVIVFVEIELKDR